MGSAFAGVKSGIIGGFFYAGSIGAFNAILLIAFKGSVIAVLSHFPECSGTTPGGATPTAEECFSTLLSVWIPVYVVLAIFIISLFFAGIFGSLFERLPGERYTTRATIVSFIMLIVLLFLGYEGISTTTVQRILIDIFDAIATLIYAVVLATLYKRYTRTVEFSSQDANMVRVIVDGKDLTGRSRTFSVRSTHKVRAEASADKVFKGWSYSGGLTLDDEKSYEALMTVNGDGRLKA